MKSAIFVFLIHVLYANSKPNICDFGRIPGYWNFSCGIGDRWQSLDQGCQLRNLISNITQPPNLSCDNVIRILFLTDSVDKQLLTHACKQFGNRETTVDTPEIEGINLFSVQRMCAFGHIEMAMRYIPGVHQEGPFNQQWNGCPTGRVSSFWNRTGDSKLKFHQHFGSEPQIVVLASNFWDIQRIGLYEQPEIGDPTVGFSKFIIESYMANMTEWIRLAKITFSPNTILVYHTHTLPQHDPSSDVFVSLQSNIMKWSQLNAAGRFVAAREDIHIVDMDMMGRSFSAEVLDADPHHPKDWLLLETLNVYLNLLAQASPHKFTC